MIFIMLFMRQLTNGEICATRRVKIHLKIVSESLLLSLVQKESKMAKDLEPKNKRRNTTKIIIYILVGAAIVFLIIKLFTAGR